MLPWVAEAAPDVRHTEDVVVSAEGMITWQTNRYSVPAELIGEIVALKIDTVSNEAAIEHEGAVIRSMKLHRPRSRRIDRREEDTRSLRERWRRENASKSDRAAGQPPEVETETFQRLRGTAVETRHPAAYDNITECSA